MVVGHLPRQSRQLVPMGHELVFRPHLGVPFLDIFLDEGLRLDAAMEAHAALQVFRHAAQSLQPPVEARLELGSGGHGHLYAAQRVEGAEAFHDDDLAVEPPEDALYELAPKGLGSVFPHVHAHDNLGGVELLEGVLDAVGDVGGDAHLRLHHQPYGVGLLGDVVQQLPSPLLVVQPLLVVVYHVERHHAPVERAVAHEVGHFHQQARRFGVFHGYHDFLVVGHLFLGHGALLFQGHFLGGAFRAERAEYAGDQYEDDGAVEHVVVEQSLPVGQENAVSHQHGRQRGACLRRAKAEYHVALQCPHAQQLLGKKGSYPLGGERHHDHHRGHVERLHAPEEQVDVDEHAHAYQEIRDEEGVAHELQVVHQGRHVGHVAIDHQSHEEGAQQSLHAYQLHHDGPQEREGQHEDELVDVVLVVVEEIAGDAGEEIDDDEEDRRHLQEKHEPELTRDVSLEVSAHHGQHQERQRVGDGRGSHGDGHAALAGKAIP